MKIKEITEITSFYVETDEDLYNFYTRHSADCWFLRMGETDEPIFACEDIEEMFQQYLSKSKSKSEWDKPYK